MEKVRFFRLAQFVGGQPFPGPALPFLRVSSKELGISDIVKEGSCLDPKRVPLPFCLKDPAGISTDPKDMIMIVAAPFSTKGLDDVLFDPIDQFLLP
jgi:hypothetical protein